jgi:hypothetical protein
MGRKLEEYNNKFSALSDERHSENSSKSKMRVIDIRKEIDNCYGNMVRCIEVATILNSNHNLMPFINELTSLIDRYRNTLAVRAGRAEAKKTPQHLT